MDWWIKSFWLSPLFIAVVKRVPALLWAMRQSTGQSHASPARNLWTRFQDTWTSSVRVTTLPQPTQRTPSYKYFIHYFTFYRWQTWCSRISTTQTGAKLPEGSGNKATTGSSYSGVSFSYTDIECLLDCAFLYLHAHKISVFPQALNYATSSCNAL